MNPIRKLITDSEDVSLSIFDASGSDRALTEVTSQVFLLILAIGLIGGLAVTLGGVTDGILPGPEGNVEVQQSGDTMSVTIDTLDDDVDEVLIVAAEYDDGTDPSGLSEADDDNPDDVDITADLYFDDADPGQTGTFELDLDDVDETTINIVAYDTGNSQSNRIATYTAS